MGRCSRAGRHQRQRQCNHQQSFKELRELSRPKRPCTFPLISLSTPYTHNHASSQSPTQPSSPRLPSHSKLHPPPQQILLRHHRLRPSHRNPLLHPPHPLRPRLDRSRRLHHPALNAPRPPSRRPEHLELDEPSREILGRAHKAIASFSCDDV